MNDSHSTKITLADVKYVSVETLLNLSFEALHELENEADKAVYDAGTRLEWIRGAIALKKKKQGASDASAS